VIFLLVGENVVIVRISSTVVKQLKGTCIVFFKTIYFKLEKTVQKKTALFFFYDLLRKEPKTRLIGILKLYPGFPTFSHVY